MGFSRFSWFELTVAQNAGKRGRVQRRTVGCGITGGMSIWAKMKSQALRRP
jgi:hypothetical protein